MIEYKIASSESEMLVAWALAVSVSIEQGTPEPSGIIYANALQNRELMIGKDGPKVVAFCLFHQEGEHIVRSYVCIHKDYRQQGIAIDLRAACVEEWRNRGATYETSRIPQASEWLNLQLTKRGAVLIGTEELPGGMFNVYRREW